MTTREFNWLCDLIGNNVNHVVTWPKTMARCQCFRQYSQWWSDGGQEEHSRSHIPLWNGNERNINNIVCWQKNKKLISKNVNLGYMYATIGGNSELLGRFTDCRSQKYPNPWFKSYKLKVLSTLSEQWQFRMPCYHLSSAQWAVSSLFVFFSHSLSVFHKIAKHANNQQLVTPYSCFSL